jgi:hypothetical protein
VVITVVVKVENPVDFGVAADSEILGVLHALRDCLPRVFLHLDVVELPETEERARALLESSLLVDPRETATFVGA